MTEEIELRYKIQTDEMVVSALRDLGAHAKGSKRIVDHWFLPLEINSQAEQDEWFDSGRGCGIRIRESFGIDGGVVTTMGTKRVNNEHGHKALSEAEVVVESFAKASLLLQMMDRREFLTIDKTRKTFELGEFEIVVDSILNYGVGVEIEYKGTRGIDEAFAKIKELAGKLGLGDGDQFEKSLTVDAMQVLAKY